MCLQGLFAHFGVSTGWRFGRHVYETGVLHAEPPQPAYKEGRHVHLRNVDGRHIEGIGSPCMPVSLQGMPTHLQGPAHLRPPLQRSKRLNRRLDSKTANSNCKGGTHTCVHSLCHNYPMIIEQCSRKLKWSIT